MFCWKGSNVQVSVFGSSHASEIGVEIDGLPCEQISVSQLQDFLDTRKGGKCFSTSRVEEDKPTFTCGITDGKIDGKVRAILENRNARSADYANLFGKPRPSHADFAAFCKDGRLDFSGGGEFSGRMTAPVCIAGGIAKQLLDNRGIGVFAYVSAVGKVRGFSYKATENVPLQREEDFPSLSHGKEMLAEISAAKANGDSVGGVVQCLVFGHKAGIGGALFDGLESKIAYLLYAIPAVKGVEFGLGFDIAERLGSAANDCWRMEHGRVVALSNNAGGINGGIANGMPITLSVAFRPTPSIAKRQKTVDLTKGVDTEIQIKGRHDACIVPRAVPVVESVVALAILDEVLSLEKKK